MLGQISRRVSVLQAQLSYVEETLALLNGFVYSAPLSPPASPHAAWLPPTAQLPHFRTYMKGRDLLTEKTRHIRRYRYDYLYRPWADRWRRVDQYPDSPKQEALTSTDVDEVQAKVLQLNPLLAHAMKADQVHYRSGCRERLVRMFYSRARRRLRQADISARALHLLARDQLERECRTCGLDHTGSKPALIDRILDMLQEYPAPAEEQEVQKAPPVAPAQQDPPADPLLSGEFDGENSDTVLVRCGCKSRLSYFYWLRTRKSLPNRVDYHVLDKLSDAQLKKEWNTCSLGGEEAAASGKGDLIVGLLGVLEKYPQLPPERLQTTEAGIALSIPKAPTILQPINSAIQHAAFDFSRLVRPKEIAELMSRARLQDVVLIDIQGQATFAKYLVIGTGLSMKHIYGAATAVQHLMRERCSLELGGHWFKISTDRRMRRTMKWLCVDAGDVMAHMMVPEERERYRIEDLWALEDGSNIEAIQPPEGMPLTLDTITLPGDARASKALAEAYQMLGVGNPVIQTDVGV